MFKTSVFPKHIGSFYCANLLILQMWQEAYGGWTSALIWTLVFHSAQREIRERYHYSVDCVLAFYVGIFLWKITGFLWSAKDLSLNRRLVKLEKIQGPLLQAAKDADVDKVRNLLEEVESSDESNQEASLKTILYGCGIILLALVVVIVTLVTTSDG
ncbi:hypothetical protein GIB67_022011 [Kingdonia uniflora]|uniref:Sphingomyelin synthase-like domain-containing protein n=1 Tax=Kingdonia uniflora TaxID=39325 RepID=A0A7J7N8M0_9MAGN|nr:hypothetical protein GIB67_020165 [Kingdonia uniflora]KAF6173557.1 hypothetical protein GIB67_022011 [Kingdonia uniflora]